MSDTWESWRPDWAPLVEGRYTKRIFDEETGLPDEQRIEMLCTRCGATWKIGCTSGLVRQHINNFAKSHTHIDPLAPKK